MASKATIKRLNGELKSLKEKFAYMKSNEPEEFLKQHESITEETRLVKLALYRIIVEEYPRQNPLKWAGSADVMGKKDRMLKKLAFMEAGGLEEKFVYNPIDAPPTVPAVAVPGDPIPPPAPVPPPASIPPVPVSSNPEVKAEITPESPATQSGNDQKTANQDNSPRGEFPCTECQFDAKSMFGLQSHSRKHK